MNRSHYYLILVILCALISFPQPSRAQRKEQQEGLLWRITGNGLSNASYLYGTIHLTDKRVFNFGDSLYAALEKCGGYAMEVNPDSIMIEFFRENEQEEKKLLKDELSSKDFNRIKSKLKERFDKPAEKVTVKEFRNYFNEWVNQLNEKGNMRTIMDAYFYDAARRQGKWVGGIEDIADQRDTEETETPVESYIPDFLNDNKAAKSFLEEMIRVYNNEDLGKIDELFNSPEDNEEKKIMLRRNRKMARRIDSLAHIRSTFFAIGTAHLPGDSGVINYLRQRGFTLQPVISSKRIHASDYKFPVKPLPWVTIKSASGFYSVEMPGEPQKETPGLEYDNLDMKMYGDISTNLFYISMGAVGKNYNNEDSVLDKLIKNLNRKARITKSKVVRQQGIKGKELIAKADKLTYRVQVYFNASVVYLAMVSSPSRDAVYSNDAERFLKSFTINKKYEAKPVAWKPVVNNGYGFSLQFPGNPTIDSAETDESNTIASTKYSAIDLENNVFFQCLVQELKRGYYLTRDTQVLGRYRDNIKANKAVTGLRTRLDTINNYPAMWVEFSLSDGTNTYYNRALNLHRGNRLYFLFTTAGDSITSKEITDRFFSSFSMVPVKESEWSLQEAPDNSFSTWATGTVIKHADTNNVQQGDNEIYDVFDPSGPVTYYVRKTHYPKFFWEKNDTTLLRREVNTNTRLNDSLLDYKPVKNGKYTGVEILVKMADNHNLKKMRYILAGDTLYTLYGIIANEFMIRENNRRFFEDFRINHHPGTTAIYTKKIKQLFNALHSEDSVTFEQATQSLSLVKFEKEDLPLLHDALLQWYPDSSNSNNTNTQLFDIVAGLEDESTVEWVKQNYNRLPEEKEIFRYNILCLLAAQKTTQSYILLKELILQQPPQKGNAWLLYGALKDSMSLTATTVFPEMLSLLKDSANSWQVISLAEDLLDSNLLTVHTLATYRNEIYDVVIAWLNELQQNGEADNWYVNSVLIRILGKLGQPEDFHLIQSYLTKNNRYIKYLAATTLLKYHQPVDTSVFTELAAENEYRLDLYEKLEELKKLSLFPKKYLTQQAFAESQLYSYASDDYEVKEMKFLGERIINFKGERRKFYLFKIDVSYEDEEVIHLGIAGPYALKATTPDTYGKATGLVWDKDFDEATIEEDFKEYIEEVEEYDY